MRDNALCVQITLTQSRARCVALPVHDAANKLYVLQNVQILKDQQDEIKKKIAAFQNNKQINISNISKFQNDLTR